MKILIATGIYPPDIGGPATYSSLLKKELPKRGIDIKIVTYGPAGISRKIPKGLRHLIYFFVCFFKALKTDIVYAQNQISAGLPAMLAAKVTGRRFIIKIVGDSVWEKAFQEYDIKDNIDEFQKKKYAFKVELLRKLQKWVVKRAGLIIVPSKYLKEIVIGWGIDFEKIKVVYNALDRSRSTQTITPNTMTSSGTGRAQKNAEIDKKNASIILSAGRLVPWKGFDVLIKILKELPREIALKIVGTGPEEKKLKKLVSKLDLEKRVKFLGKLEHKKLLQLMNESGIFVLNSGYEGFPHIILEAMTMNLPVITTNTCGNPEIVKDNYNGLLVKHNNKKQIKEAILKLWEDKKLKKKFTENAKKSLNKFSEEKMIRETLRVLK